MAVIRAYGGLKGSGSPCGPSIFGQARLTHGMFDSGCSECTSPMMSGMCVDGIYSTPVSGSNAAPPQSAPPLVPGWKIVPIFPLGVPTTSGGVNSWP